MYLTEAFLQDAFGSDQVAALCPTADELSTTIELAEAEVESALEQGGYESTYPSSVYAAIDDVPKQIKLAAYGAWLELAFLRTRRELPPEARPYTHKIELIRKGELSIPGVSRSTIRAPGGATATESSTSVQETSGARPAIFTRTTLAKF